MRFSSHSETPIDLYLVEQRQKVNGGLSQRLEFPIPTSPARRQTADFVRQASCSRPACRVRGTAGILTKLVRKMVVVAKRHAGAYTLSLNAFASLRF
jgi:hypothetical protein